MSTHYIPYFTREYGRQRETVCGAHVLPSEHSTEPNCPACRAWLVQDAADEAETMRSLGLVYRDGCIVPGGQS